MQHEYRTLKLPVKLETREDGKPRIEGYAAVFYRADDPGTEYKIYDDIVERVMPTAFTEHFSAARDCKALFNHDAGCLLGREGNRTLTLSVDQIGLRYSIDPPDTQLGRDMVAYLARGDISGSSFAFRVTGQTWKEVGSMLYRQIDSVELFDVGPVTYPAYEATTAGLRSRDLDAIRKEADVWRKANRPRPSLAHRRRQLRLVEAE